MAKGLCGDDTLALRAWHPVRSGALVCRADITLETERFGALEVDGCCAFESGGRRWVSLPAERAIDKDNRPRVDDRGKKIYKNITRWTSRDAADRFGQEVIALLEKVGAFGTIG